MNTLCTTLLPNFIHIKLYHSSYKHLFTGRVESNKNPDQITSLEASWSGTTVFFLKMINPGSAGQEYKIWWILTLKVPVTIAADDKYCDIFPNLQKK